MTHKVSREILGGNLIESLKLFFIADWAFKSHAVSLREERLEEASSPILVLSLLRHASLLL